MTGGDARVSSFATDGGVIEADIAWEGAPGEPIVFLHGWTLDRRVWAPQMKALSARHPVIAIDRRGFGRSTAPASLAREPDDLIAILDALSIRSCVLVGMSQAGRVALDFALRYPARLKALVLQGAQLEGLGPETRPPEEIPIAAYRELVRAGNIAGMRAQWRAHPLMRTPDAKAQAVLDEILNSYDGRDLLAPPSSPARIGPETLSRIQTPMLVVTGDLETPQRMRTADAIAEAAPCARRAVIENAGHTCNLCNADAYNSAIEEFLSGLPVPLRRL